MDGLENAMPYFARCSGDSGGRPQHSGEVAVLRPQGSDNCSGGTDPAVCGQRAQ